MGSKPERAVPAGREENTNATKEEKTAGPLKETKRSAGPCSDLYFLSD